VGAEKSAAPARDVRAQDARFPQEHQLARLAPPAAAGLCTPGAVRSAAQLCAGQARQARLRPEAEQDSAEQLEEQAQQMLRSTAWAWEAARAPQREAASPDAVLKGGRSQVVRRQSQER
jgi:hypothetical protein